jgi:hypothetical protein
MIEIRLRRKLRIKEVPISPDDPVNRIRSALILFILCAMLVSSNSLAMTFMENKTVLF